MWILWSILAGVILIALIFVIIILFNKFVGVTSTKTNAYSIIGKKALVIKEITSHSSGQIKIKEEVWSADSLNDEDIPENTEVEVVKINGVKAIVK